jgi:hypothetical protein
MKSLLEVLGSGNYFSDLEIFHSCFLQRSPSDRVKSSHKVELRSLYAPGFLLQFRAILNFSGFYKKNKPQ